MCSQYLICSCIPFLGIIEILHLYIYQCRRHNYQINKKTNWNIYFFSFISSLILYNPSMETTFFLIWWIGIGLLVGFLFAKLFFYQSIQAQRTHAVKQSKATTFGYVSEALAPLAPEFPYHVKDLMFLGKWVDYLVFDGLHEWHLRKIRFLEIKTNTSQLSQREKMIKEAIEKGRVGYEVLRISKKATSN